MMAPYSPERAARTLRERFDAKWTGEPNTGCWLWLGTISKAGYGVITSKVDGKWTLQYAHRLSYEWARGEISAALELDHKCRVTFCINPEHLEPVTHHENIKRGAIFTRLRRPTCHNGHLLTEENVYLRKDGGRICAVCSKERALRHYYANKEPSQ